ncbi:hypothetical protein H0A36_31345, partial [Endozoicomonas sp. SM1973]
MQANIAEQEQKRVSLIEQRQLLLDEIARRKQRKDWMGALSATLLFVTLATASILGSIGGLQSDTQRVQANIAEQEQKRVSLIEQRQLLLDEIA